MNIRNFLQVDERIASSGMPNPEDFSEIAKNGYGVVINLALPTSDNAIANEGELVSKEGMSYVHLPIKFDAPTREDYERFARIMDVFTGQKVFVHCAANMRVSAFLFLYSIQRGEERAGAMARMKKIWEPNAVWSSFINEWLRINGYAELT